ncbi:MAG: branched-chain amino acid ABC transporter permease, partial [Deltaproteobacteria bacterium]|nr:branched-chain amino acid ABC transporter permease [Deltaproteobacteria bacterium]
IVNFAQGEFVMLGGMFMVTFYSVLRLPMAVAFSLTVISVALIGMLLEKGPIRHARSKEVLILVMITVGASITLKGLSMTFFGKNPMILPPFSGDVPLMIAEFAATALLAAAWRNG